ncbi:hypothetical protein MBLNU457_2112t1 [Dothideomycetes sp. NU457]
MDALLAAHKKLERQGGLNQTIQDVQATIDLLTQARESIANDAPTAPMTLAKLKNPMKQSFDKLNQDVKELHSAINNYSKALDKKFKTLVLPTASNDPFSSYPALTNRAISMHLLREGQFPVAATFIEEVNTKRHEELQPLGPGPLAKAEPDMVLEDKSWQGDHTDHEDTEEQMDDFDTMEAERPLDLQNQFTDMYRILYALQTRKELDPAIHWAQKHSKELESRGSNLEFELCRLRFVELFRSDPDGSGPLKALEYARNTFPSFSSRYLKEQSALIGSVLYSENIEDSPYSNVYFNNDAWEQTASSFTREFCGLLGLSETSPLYTAVTAGGMALPVLEKLERKMGAAGGQWTSANELPVEIPLPATYQFHSIFVCPVSKEQGTDVNPPMMMPCGHVIAKESLEKVSRGGK